MHSPILDTIAHEAKSALRHYYPDDIFDVAVQQEIRVSTVTGERVEEYRVSCSSRAPELALGQFLPFAERESIGFTLGLLRGWIAARVSEVGYSSIHLDLFSENWGCQPIYRCATLDEAIEKHLTNRGSPLANELESNELGYVLLGGSQVSGPSLGMLGAAKKLCLAQELGNWCELFSGSGVISLLANRSGAKSNTTYDLIAPIAKEASRSNWTHFCEDVLHGLLPDLSRFDVVFADPFYGYTWSFLEQLSGEIDRRPRYLILNGGRSILSKHQERIAEFLRCLHYECKCQVRYGEAIYECRLDP